MLFRSFNVYNYYLYVADDAKTVRFKASAAHKDAIVTINEVSQDANGGWDVILAEEGDTRVVITVREPNTNVVKHYTVMVIRNRLADPAPDNYPIGVIQDIVVNGVSVKRPTLGRADTVTVEPNDDDTITVQVKAPVFELTITENQIGRAHV